LSSCISSTTRFIFLSSTNSAKALLKKVASNFGVSAATGGLADDHDVLAFITHSLVDQKNIVNSF
jgi:hypothetical protein